MRALNAAKTIVLSSMLVALIVWGGVGISDIVISQYEVETGNALTSADRLLITILAPIITFVFVHASTTAMLLTPAFAILGLFATSPPGHLYMMPLGIAFMLAIPLGWWELSTWLSVAFYRIAIKPRRNHE